VDRVVEGIGGLECSSSQPDCVDSEVPTAQTCKADWVLETVCEDPCIAADPGCTEDGEVTQNQCFDTRDRVTAIVALVIIVARITGLFIDGRGRNGWREGCIAKEELGERIGVGGEVFIPACRVDGAGANGGEDGIIVDPLRLRGARWPWRAWRRAG
jgi:hypothetical protein